MIENQAITHNSFSHSFFTWKPSNPFLEAYVAAILTTILTYQITAIVIDFCVGLKNRYGYSSRSDLFTILMVGEGSILATMAGICSSKHMLRRRFGVKVPDRKMNDLQRSKVPKLVAIKYIFLVCVPVLVSVLSIALVQNYTKVVSFGEANFGGMALGFTDPSKVVESMPVMTKCSKLALNLDKDEIPASPFFLCSEPSVFVLPPNQTNTFVEFTKLRDESYRIILQHPQVRFEDLVYIDIHTKNGLYRVKGAINESDSEQLVNNIIEKIETLCESSKDELLMSHNYSFDTSHETYEWIARQTTGCVPDDVFANGSTFGGYNKLSKIFLDTIHQFSPIDVDRLMIAKLTEGHAIEAADFEDGAGLPLLVRSRPITSIPFLGSITLMLLLVRVILRPLFANDIYLGIEILLKEALNLDRYETMLANDSIVAHSDAKIRVS